MLRDEVLKVLEEARTAKEIGNRPSEAQVTVGWLNSVAADTQPPIRALPRTSYPNSSASRK